MSRKQNIVRKLKWGIVIISLMIAGIALFLMNYSPLGGSISGERLKRVQASSHYRDGGFVNTMPQSSLGWASAWKLTVEQLLGDQIRVPPSAIPIVRVKPEDLATPPRPGLRAIWLGHASVLIEMDGFRFLVDPIFSDYASPFNFIGPKRFHPPPIALTALPPIDAVMISHDHYDHLDMKTVQTLSDKGTHFFVPLGVGAHLEEWLVPDDLITELDWWESKKLGNITVISTPTRHYSGRGLTDYKKTFWSSWSVIGPKHRVFYSGDTGYSDHFQEIGDQLGPFDLSIIKIGAYGPEANWVDIHMDPLHAIKAHLAVRGRQMLPVHWATFNMAFHDWDEPIVRAVKAASENNVDLLTPRVGELVNLGQVYESSAWWEEVK